jgi:hypothetical protein
VDGYNDKKNLSHHRSCPALCLSCLFEASRCDKVAFLWPDLQIVSSIDTHRISIATKKCSDLWSVVETSYKFSTRQDNKQIRASCLILFDQPNRLVADRLNNQLAN